MVINKKISLRLLAVIFSIAVLISVSFSQSKRFSIQYTLPSNITVCSSSDSIVFEIRNIYTSGISNVYNTIRLPAGCKYISGSLKGSGTSEYNKTNLDAPIFKFQDFTLAGYLKFSIKITADCNLQNYISKGNQAFISCDLSYTGGTEVHYSGNINVKSSNILINYISNQVKNAYLNDVFTREISLKNTGNGKATEFLFFRVSGSGVSIKSSRIKDQYSGDSIISKFDSSDFLKIGNNDKYFDAGEEFKIIDTAKVISCSNLSTIYNLKFGCDNSLCNTSTKNAIINIDAFTQGLTITPSSQINWCFDKNQPTKNGLIIINKSNKEIKNTIINIIQSYNGGFYASQMSGIDTSTLTITKGKWGNSIKKIFTALNYNNIGNYFTCLGSKPVGLMSLNLGNLKTGDTIYMKWNSFSCIPDICGSTITAHRWTYSASYSDFCGSNYQLKETWGSYGGVQYFSTIAWIPTDIAVGSPEKLNYTITSSSLISFNSKSLIAIKLKLSAGLKHSLNADEIKFTDNDGKDWKPYKVANDSKEIWAYFNNPSISILKSELNILINADCKGTSSGIKDISIDILYKIDSTCNSSYFQLYCNTTQTKVHCKLNCNNGGMLFRGFRVLRKNYGLPDNNNDGLADATGVLDMKKVKSNISFLYDTISANYSGIVFTSGTTKVFFNGKLKTSVANGQLITPVSTQVRIFRNGKLRYYCDRLSMTSSLSGTNRNCELDFTSNAAKTASCPNYGNYFFLNGDSVLISLNFVYSTSIGYASGEVTFNNTEFFLSTTPNPTSSQKLQCDTFSGRHILSGNYFTDYYTENYSSNNCSGINLSQSFYFSAGNCCNNYAGGNQFPFEYRNFNYLDKIGVILPLGYTYKDASFYYYYSNGTSKYQSQSISGLKPVNISADTLFFKLDTLFNPSKGIFKLSDEGYQATLILNISPSCKSSINTLEPIKYLSYYKWRVNNKIDIKTNYLDFVQFDHPKILISPVNSNSYSNKDTFAWDVIITNSNSGSDINNLWIANTSKTKATIIAVKDLTKGTFLQKQADIFKAGSLNSTNPRSFRIYAKSANCKTDSIKVAFGWNCINYPDSFENYECKNLLKNVSLTLSPLPPLINSVLFDDTTSTDVCTNRFFEALIANTDEENVYNLKLKVTIPQGTTFVDTGMYYSFPFGSKFIKLSKPVILSGNTYIWNLSDSISTLKQGLSKVSDSVKSKIKIRFYLETNCNIIAGSVVSIMPDGTMGCGEPVRKIGFTGSPIKIKGAENPYFTSVKLSYDSINLCKPDMFFKAKIIYLGPVKTRNGDSILLSLPKGFYPDTSSLITKNIIGRGNIVNNNNQINWVWSIPSGTYPGDSSEMSFKLKIDGSTISCGQEQFSLTAFTKKKAFCVKSNDSCYIKSSTGIFSKTYKLKKSNPLVNLLKATSINGGDSGEIAEIVFNVKNDLNEVDSTYSSKFYLIADRNSNGKFDAPDYAISSFIKSKGVLPNEVLNFNFKGFIKNIDACNLMIVSDLANCQCLKNVVSIYSLKLNNAGRDTTFCSNYKVNIGLDSVKKFKYEWLPSYFLKNSHKSKTEYFKYNQTKTEEYRTYIIKTTKPGSCFSYDTVKIISNPAIFLPKLKDTLFLCAGKSVNIGDTAKGGKGTLNFFWSPSSGLSSTSKMIVNAGPLIPIKYFINISDQNNCKIKDSVYVKIVYAPIVKIAYDGKCEKKEIKFKDASDYRGAGKGNVVWKINFNNIYLPDPTFVYDTIGNYYTRLVAENEYGCIDSAYKYVRIFGNPVLANSKQNFCLDDSVKLIDLSTVAQMKVKTVIWKFSNDSLFGKTVSKSFSTNGKHYFYHVAVSDSGCVSSILDSVYITQKPQASFIKTKQCLYDSILFTDVSTSFDNDTINVYNWTVTEKNYSSNFFKVKFDTSGIYKVSLNVKTKNNCSDSVSNTFTINSVPVALFNSKNYCPYDTVIVIENSSLKTGNILSFCWNLDDKINSFGKIYTNSLISEGVHKLKLIVKSDSSCSDSIEKFFTIYPPLQPFASFSTACENDSVKCTDLTLQTKTTIISRNWIYKKQNYYDSTCRIPAGAKGIHPISLKLISKENCEFDTNTTFIVYEKPRPYYDYLSKCNDNSFNLIDKSIAGANAITISRNWIYDNILINKVDSVFTNKFKSTGEISLKLIIKNTFECIDSIIKKIEIPKENFVDFIANDACPNDSVKINFTGYTGNNKINLNKVNWGDGENSSTIPLTHSYVKSGKFLINFEIETFPGCKFDTSKYVTIHPVPQASFNYYPPYPDIKKSKVSITDNSSDAVSWNYQISNGATLNTQNPVYNFTDSGKYTIVQFAVNRYGCVDTAIRQIYVNYILLTYIPNSFSPGNDNVNQEFYPEGLGIKEYRMTIYNRWGETVFDSNWGKNSWDGTYKGEYVTSGIYHYFMQIRDFGNKRHDYSGVLNIIR